jgi:hypothetical protein
MVSVKLIERADPAVERPVVAQANLDVNGRLVRAQVEGVTAREAVDRLEARLRHRLERAAEHWEARRGKLPVVGPHEWRHESEPTHRPSYFPHPEDERQIIRRKSFTVPTSTVDEAALQMDLLDYHSPVHRGGHEHRQCPLPCRTDGLPSGTSEPSIGRVAGRLRAARDRHSAASAAAYC